MSEGLIKLFVLQMRGYAQFMSLQAAFDKMTRTYLGMHSFEMDAARKEIEEASREFTAARAC